MPEQRENPDSRRAARELRVGDASRAEEARPLTRRALREARQASVPAVSRSFAVTEESLALAAAMADALHATVGAVLVNGATHTSARVPHVTPVDGPRPAPAIQHAATDEQAEVLAATLPLPVVVDHPPIFRPRAYPPTPLTVPLVVGAASAQPLLPSAFGRRRAPARHVRARLASGVGAFGRAGASLSLAIAGLFMVGSAAGVTAALAPPAEPAPQIVAIEATGPELAEVRIEAPTAQLGPLPAASQAALPEISTSAESAVVLPCTDPAVASALAVGDDPATLIAAGGATAFREAVSAGNAPCIPLDDPARVWVVVDKARPLAPIDYQPAPLAVPGGVRVLDGGQLRQDAADAMSAMVEAARVAGAGEIGVGSAFRSYETQVATYDSHVARRGAEGADLVSARPGYSEHQTGLAADVVPCGESCGTIDDLAASAQGAWVAEHAWEYGWIVRYPDGGTDVTGYLPEPWHLRYIGTELAREYHDGGWRTLEEFFGLPAAPHYGH